MTLAFACFFFGSWLGMRFKVAVLVPAIFFVIVLIWLVGLFAGQEQSLVAAAQVAAVVAVQFGYLSAAWIAARFGRSKLGASLTSREYP
jgi:hypothetical protein